MNEEKRHVRTHRKPDAECFQEDTFRNCSPIDIVLKYMHITDYGPFGDFIICCLSQAIRKDRN